MRFGCAQATLAADRGLLPMAKRPKARRARQAPPPVCSVTDPSHISHPACLDLPVGLEAVKCGIEEALVRRSARLGFEPQDGRPGQRLLPGIVYSPEHSLAGGRERRIGRARAREASHCGAVSQSQTEPLKSASLPVPSPSR